jgi:hypothetical protein
MPFPDIWVSGKATKRTSALVKAGKVEIIIVFFPNITRRLEVLEENTLHTRQVDITVEEDDFREERTSKAIMKVPPNPYGIPSNFDHEFPEVVFICEGTGSITGDFAVVRKNDRIPLLAIGEHRLRDQWNCLSPRCLHGGLRFAGL